MKNIYLYSFILVTLIFNSVCADKFSSFKSWKNQHLRLSFVTGMASMKNQQMQLYIDDVTWQPLFNREDTFTYDGATDNSMFIGFGIAYQRKLSTTIDYTLGVEIDKNQHQLKGTHKLQLNSTSDKVFYTFDADNTLVLLHGVWNFKLYNTHWISYVETGLGVSWNTFKNYYEIKGKTTFLNGKKYFPDNTATQFSYMGGIGIDYQFSSGAVLNIGYRYQNIGHFESGEQDDIYPNQRLKTNTISISEIVLRLSF